MNFEKKVFESDVDYLFRLVEIKMEVNPQDLDWSDIVEYTGLGCHPDSLRKACQPKTYGAYAVYKAFKNNKADYTSEEIDRKHQLKIDLQKLRDENLALNEKLRAISRPEYITELIEDKVSKLEPLPTPNYYRVNTEVKSFLGGVADVHFGKEIKINGLQGETIAEYNEFIIQDRFNQILNEYKSLVNDYGFTKLYFADLGDNIENVLRISSLQSIKYSAVDSTIMYAHILADLLNNISEFVDIEYYGCQGNHDELRILNGKSGDFAKDNMHKVVVAILRAELKNNNRIKIHDSKKMQYFDMDGYKILAVHGQDEKSLVNSVKEYKEIYDVKIDYMISGHLHNAKSETASLRTKVFQYPSIIGLDEFGLSLKKTSNPEAKVLFKQGNRLFGIDIQLR